MFNLKGYGLQLICYSLLLLLIKFGAFTSAAEHQQHDTEQDVISMRDLQKSASNAPHESGKYMLAVVLLGVVPFVGVLLIAGTIILCVKLLPQKQAQMKSQSDKTFAIRAEPKN